MGKEKEKRERKKPMLSAEEAFEKSKQKLEETVQSIDDLLIMKKMGRDNDN